MTNEFWVGFVAGGFSVATLMAVVIWLVRAAARAAFGRGMNW